jgi:hypothetical protein
MRYTFFLSFICLHILAFSQTDSLKFKATTLADGRFMITADYKEEEGFYAILVQNKKDIETDSLKKGLVPYRYRANVSYEKVMKEREEYNKKRLLSIENLKNTPIPDFDARDTTGFIHRPMNYVGRVLILHFWYFWNSSLDYEIPILNKMIDRYQSQGPEILSFVDDDLRKDEKEMLLKNPVRFPLIPNSKEFARKFIDIDKTTPYLILVDKLGKIRHLYIDNELKNPKSDLYNAKDEHDISGFEKKLTDLLK